MKMIRLLYIEDNEAARFIAREQFAESGFAIDFAENANEAIEKIDNNIYDIIVSDMMLPDGDGIEIAKVLSARPESTPIALTSTEPALRSAEHYMGLQNYIGFILKPLTPKKLLEKWDTSNRIIGQE